MQKNVISMIFLVACIASAEILTLSDAELKSVSTSYEMRSSHFNEQAREWEKRNALTSYLPKVTVESGYTRIDDKSYQARKMMGAYKATIGHSLTITQPITNGGAELIAIGIAKETMQAIELEKLDLEQQVIYSTRKAYFGCITLLESIDALKKDYSWTMQNLNMAKIRYEGGGIPGTDVLQFESDITKKENDIAGMQATYQTALETFYHTIGLPVDKVNDSIQFLPVEVFETWFNKGPAKLVWDTDSVLQVRALRHYTNITKSSKKVVMTQFLPSINTFFTTSSAQNEDFFKNDPASWVGGVNFNLTLFSGFRNSTKLQQADYDYKKALVELEKNKNQINVNIGRILKSYEVSYEGVIAVRKQVELMEKQLQIMQQRYVGGQVNQLELLSVALAVRNTKIGYTQKLFECLLYESEFLRYTGKLEVSQ